MKGNSKAKLAISIILLIIIGYFSYPYIKNLGNDYKLDESQKPPVRVITKQVEKTKNDKFYRVISNGKAIKSVFIYSPVDEEVSEIYFTAGKEVSKGDLLVQLDDEEEKLAVKLAKVELRDAKSLLERYENAVKDGAVPQSDVDSARASFEAAQVRLEQANFQLSERKIIAPFDGVVGLQMVDVGDRINSSTVITSLDDESIILIDSEIPEAYLSEIKSGDKFTATTPAYRDKKFEATILEIGNRVDQESRTVRVRSQIKNEKDLLKSGMSFESNFVFEGKEYFAIPEISLQWGRDGSYVWVVRDSKSERVDVKVIARKSGRVLIDGDIKDGELVVMEGVQRLRNGRVVSIGDSNE
jgi:RND family efflux transporter MFP subunit